MIKKTIALCVAVAFFILAPVLSTASDLEEKYEELLEQQGYVVKQNITITSPTYYMVEVEAVENVTLQCTAYFMEEIKLSDTYRITPDDEVIVFRIPDSKVNRFVCEKAAAK
jgi:hypothetical protein